MGTCVLVLFGVGTALYAGDYVSTALAFGLTVIVMSVTVGKISGCHLNPAISVAMFLDKKLDQKDLIGYIVAQVIGGILAGLILVLTAMSFGADFSEAQEFMNGGANHAAYQLETWGVLFIEIIMTFFFVLVVFGATSKNSGAINGGLYIGLALTMIHLASMSFTGTSVNPARSIGIAIFSADYLVDVWMFIVAPIIGGVLAWLVWSKVLRDPAEE
ncbi:MAG: aquaporin [archaeon]|nr:aquaporin [archaeon]